MADRYEIHLPYPEGGRVVATSGDLEDATLAVATIDGPAEIFDTEEGHGVEVGPEDLVRVLRRLQEQAGINYVFLYGRYEGRRPADIADDLERRHVPSDWINTVAQRTVEAARRVFTDLLSAVPEPGRVEMARITRLAQEYGEVNSVRWVAHPSSEATGSPTYGLGSIVINWDDE